MEEAQVFAKVKTKIEIFKFTRLRLIHENGIQQRENNLIYARKPVCTSKSSTFVSVGLVDCYPVAAVLAGGIAASLVVFILEVYLHNRIQLFKNYRRQQIRNEVNPFKEDITHNAFQNVNRAQVHSPDIFRQ